MSKPIGVGVVGASPDRGWAMRAHLPAVLASPQFTLAAVATTRAESAEAARVRFGARHAFTDASSLATHPDVDLVVVTVRVSTHAELVTAALDAGKHVYCEWPLAVTAAEASALSTAAQAAGVHHVVGLQARASPAAVRARSLIGDGHLGTVQSATVYTSRALGNTRDIPGWTAYAYARGSGAGRVEVLGGHTLDLVQYLLGPIRDLSARTAIRIPEHRIAETGETITVTAPDHLLATAELDSGAVVSIHLHDGEVALPRTRIEIIGTAGSLAITSTAQDDPWAAQPQIGPLELHESRPERPQWTPVSLPTDAASTLPVQAANVFRLYQWIASDLRDNTHTAPDFTLATDLHRLVELAGQEHA